MFEPDGAPLAGKGAVVTGGGRGIGAEVARALAAAGASVVVSARTRTEIEAVARELNAAVRDGSATPVVCDVTDPDSVADLARAATEGLGAVDILVNCAGAASSAPLRGITLEEWNRLLAVNATGPFLCMRELLPPMLERRRGRVVNVASVAGLSGGRYIAAYTASKHALVGLTRAAAAEATAAAEPDGSGVTVNAVCPAYVDTDMTTESVRRIAEQTGRSEAKALEALLTTTRQPRLIQPAEVARTVLWLCTDAAGGINGHAIVVDGGGLLA